MDIGKRCCICRKLLPLTSFGKNKNSRDGFCYQCRVCDCKRCECYRKNNKEKRLETCAKYRQNNKDKIVECRKNNKDQIALGNAEYRKNNSERISLYMSGYYRKNRDKILERCARYRENNLEVMIVWRKNNRDVACTHDAKRRAFKLNQTPVDADPKKIQFYYTVCNETNEILGGVFFHVDHIQPLSKCGLHHEDNLQILETELNLQKNNRWPLTEAEQLKYMGVVLT